MFIRLTKTSVIDYFGVNPDYRHKVSGRPLHLVVLYFVFIHANFVHYERLLSMQFCTNIKNSLMGTFA